MSSFVIVMSATLCAMEKQLEKSQELHKSESWEIINKSASEDSPPYTLSFSLPTAKDLLNGVNSITATVNNYMYDTEAFKKLGWPIDDIIAKQELEKTQEIYKRVNESLQNRTTYSDFMKDYDFINRRQAYCQRVLQALPNHPQGVVLALFCLKNHRAAMHSFDLIRFLVFIEGELEKFKKIGAEFSLLTILPEEDNQLLNKLFEQTLLKKYPKDTEQQKEKKNGKK